MAFNSSMPMFWGDYLRDTGHLSPAEHGAYLMLIAHQWTTAKPLPDSDVMLARIAKMTAREWRSAKPVIEPFFTVRNGEWSQKRVAEELVKAKETYDRRRAVGKLGGRPAKQKAEESPALANDKPGFSDGKGNAKQPKPKPYPIDDDEDRAPEDVSHVTVGETVLEIMGVREDPRYAFSYSVVGGWLAAGYDPDADIYPTIRAVMAKRNGQGPPGSLNYFTNAIGQAHRDRTTPVSPDLGPQYGKRSGKSGITDIARDLITEVPHESAL
jgi:uncharacterized protein YdaU (DUF1376 family)